MEHWKRFDDRSQRALAELHKVFLGINKKQKEEVIENLPKATGKKKIKLGELFDPKEWIGITIDLATPILTSLAKDEATAALAMIGAQHQATAETADYVFSKRTVKPKMLLVISYLNEFLVPRYGDDLYLTFIDPTPEDKEFRTKEMQAAVANMPIMTQNEARKSYLGLGPIEGGDKLMAPTTMTMAGTTQSVEGEDQTPQLAKAITVNGRYAKAIRIRTGGKSAYSGATKMRRALTDAFKKILDQRETQSSPMKARAALDRGISKMARSYNETTLQQLKDVLGEKLTQSGGTNLAELTNAVDGVYSFADERRAGLIAKTESYRAANWANREAWTQSGVVQSLMWYTAEDEKVCPAMNSTARLSASRMHFSMTTTVTAPHRHFIPTVGAMSGPRASRLNDIITFDYDTRFNRQLCPSPSLDRLQFRRDCHCAPSGSRIKAPVHAF
jgi:hypothetical protein